MIKPAAIDDAAQRGADQGDQGGRPLSDTLSAVALEIGDLAKLSDRLQSVISAALVADSSAHPDHLRDFQAIDYLVQRLHGVAAFMDALAVSAAAQDWRVDAAAAAARLPLSDLANRLGGAHASAGAVDPTSPPPTDGDLELFG